MNARALAVGRPWYTQLWPWALIGIPAVSIAVSVTALVLALRHPDPVVASDWYARGLAINQDLDRDSAAARLGIIATVTLDATARALEVRLDGGVEPEALTLDLEHPTVAARDRRLVLVRTDGGTYRASLDEEAAGRWYATVEPADGAWRLAAPLRLQTGVPVRLTPAT